MPGATEAGELNPAMGAGALRRRVSRWRVVVAASAGNMLEWYDFLVYGLMALTVGKLFFPAATELTSLLFSLATFGVGLVMRPVYADRAGATPASPSMMR